MSLPLCWHGSSCRLLSKPAHIARYAHPSKKVPCKYGAACYRKNPAHFAEYSHPETDRVANEPRMKKARTSEQSREEQKDVITQEEEDSDEEQVNVPDGADDMFASVSNPTQARAAQEVNAQRLPLLESILSSLPTPIASLVNDYAAPLGLRWTWLPQVRKCSRVPLTDTKFGGVPFLQVEEKWPECGACHNQMSFFFQLAGADLPKELRGQHLSSDQLLQMFFCTRQVDENCMIFEPFSSTSLIRVIDLTATAPASRQTVESLVNPLTMAFPERKLLHWKRKVDVPHFEDYVMYGLEPLEEDAGPEAYPEEADKLSGFPFWSQTNVWPKCPQCQEKMEFVFQVATRKLFTYTFGDCGTGHITQCPNHRNIVTFAWDCA